MAVSVLMSGCYAELGNVDAEQGTNGSSEPSESEEPGVEGAEEPGVEGAEEPGGEGREDLERTEVVTVGDVECGSKGASSTPIRLVSAAEYGALLERTFEGVALPEGAIENLPQTLSSAGYLSNAGAAVDASHQQQLLEIADSVARQVVDNFDSYADCELDRSCAESVARDYGRLTFRRTLSDVQVGELLNLYDQGDDPNASMRLLIQGLILAPDVLYQFEIGEEQENGSRRLSGVEIAAKMSYALWGMTPDTTLLDEAEAGTLDTTEGVARVARAMLDDQRALSVLRFFKQWLHFGSIGDKDADVFPEFTQEIAAAAVEESERFIESVLFKGDGRFETLVTDRTAFVTPALASMYGLSNPTSDEVSNDTWEQVTLNPDERSGLFTRLAFLATTGGTVETSIITRGVDILQNVLCIEIPEPSAGIQDSFPLVPDDPDLTPHDVIALHQEDPACASCHVFIDGMGLGFEHYDSIGRYRTVYERNGKPVDALGDLLTGIDGSTIDGPFSGAVELSDRVATSDIARNCFVDNWYRFALLTEPAENSCSLRLAEAAFAEADYDIRELIIGMMMSPDFRFRGELDL